MSGAGFFEVMLFAFALGSFVAAVMFSRRHTRNMPCGASIKARPPGDRESLLKLAEEKEEEIVKDD